MTGVLLVTHAILKLDGASRMRRAAIEGLNRHAARGVTVADLTVEIAIGVIALPDLEHRDPADRFLISSARTHDLVLVTQDQHIVACGRCGHVKVMKC